MSGEFLSPYGPNFERAKATAVYTTEEMVKYNFFKLVLPILNLVGIGLKERAELNLYQRHVELTDGADKVKKAFQTCIRDEQLCKPRPAQESSTKLLVDEYDALIARAVEIADELNIPRAVYLQDLHQKLDPVDKKNPDNRPIFQAVNKAVAKLNILQEWGRQDSDYADFLLSFVFHVQQAVAQCGSTDISYIDSIVNRFIDGLASAFGLVSYDISQDYVGDVKKADDVIEDFTRSLTDLLYLSRPITAADVLAIQYQGIRYIDIKPISEKDIEVLNALRNECLKLGAAQAFIENYQLMLTQSYPFTAEEISKFLGATPAPAFAHLADYQEAMKKIAEIDKEIQKIQDLQREFKKIPSAISRLEQDIARLEEESKRQKKHPVFHEVFIYTVDPNEKRAAELKSKREELQALQEASKKLASQLEAANLSSLTAKRAEWAQKQITLSSEDIRLIGQALSDPPKETRLGKVYAYIKGVYDEKSRLEASSAQIQLRVDAVKGRYFDFTEQEKGSIDRMLQQNHDIAKAVDQNVYRKLHRQNAFEFLVGTPREEESLLSLLPQMVDPGKYPSAEAVLEARIKYDQQTNPLFGDMPYSDIDEPSDPEFGELQLNF